MWVSTHVLAGLAIAAALGGPWWLVLIAVILAHVVMDLVPHWDYTGSRHPVFYGVCDFVAGGVAWLLAWLLLGMPFWLAAMGPLSGAPDLDVLVAEIRGRQDVHWFPSHWKRFPHGRAGRPWGIGVQVVIMAASVAVVLALRPY
jgi:hypothetical protein